MANINEPRVYHPDYLIVIKPYEGLEYTTDKVFSIQTQQDISQPAASWNIKTHDSRIVNLNPMDEIWIYASREDTFTEGKDSPTLIMRGLMDTMSESFQVSENDGSRTWEIKGRSMGKILLENHLEYAAPYELKGSVLEPCLGVTKELSELVENGKNTAKLNVVIQLLMDYCRKVYRSVDEKIDFSPLLNETQNIDYYAGWNPCEGAFWSQIDMILQNDFHVYWVDHSGTFRFKEIMKLLDEPIKHKIKDEDIHSWEFSKSDLSLVTWVSVIPQKKAATAAFAIKESGYAPENQDPFEEKNIKRYGFRMKRIQDNFCADKPQAKKKAQEALKYCSNMDTCNITVKGEPKYRVGEWVEIESLKWQYLIESVSHDFAWGDHYFTTLGLARGRNGARIQGNVYYGGYAA